MVKGNETIFGGRGGGGLVGRGPIFKMAAEEPLKRMHIFDSNEMLY